MGYEIKAPTFPGIGLADGTVATLHKQPATPSNAYLI